MREILLMLIISTVVGAQEPSAGTVEALAGSYAMAGRYDKAIAALEEALALTGSTEIQLKLAQNQAWSGDTPRAIRTYETYLQARPDDRKATMELIRLRRYRGDYSQAEKLCDRLLATQPDDPEVLALKAEVLHWAGNRRILAHQSAARAAQVAPGYPDAHVAQVYALRDLGQNRAAAREFDLLSGQVARLGITPQSTFGDAYRFLEQQLTEDTVTSIPAYSVYNDSDGIRNVFSGVRIAAPVHDDHTLRLEFSHYRSSAPLSSVFSAGREESQVTEFSAGGTLLVAPATHLTLMGGGSKRATGGGLGPTFDVQLATSPIDRWTFDLKAGREFLNVTPRAIDRDISSYKIGAGAAYAFDSRTSLAGHLDRRYWSDDNRSMAGEATFRRIIHYHRSFMVDSGILTRWEQFERDTLFASGFFTPDRYRRHDGFVGLHGELGRRITYELRGAAGAQQVSLGSGYRPSWEFASSVTVRLTKSLHLWANYQRRNYSLLSRDGWYQGFAVSLEIKP